MFSLYLSKYYQDDLRLRTVVRSTYFSIEIHRNSLSFRKVTHNNDAFDVTPAIYARQKQTTAIRTVGCLPTAAELHHKIFSPQFTLFYIHSGKWHDFTIQK